MNEKKLESIQGLPVFGERLDQNPREWNRAPADALSRSDAEREERLIEERIVDEFARKKGSRLNQSVEDDSLFDAEIREGLGALLSTDVGNDVRKRALGEEIEDWFNDLIDAHLAFENLKWKQVTGFSTNTVFLPITPPFDLRDSARISPILLAAQSRSRIWRSLKIALQNIINNGDIDSAIDAIMRYTDIVELMDCPPAMDEDCFMKYLQFFGLSTNAKLAERQVRHMESEGIIPPPCTEGLCSKGKQRYYGMPHARGGRAYLALRRTGIQLMSITEVLEPIADVQKALFLYPFIYTEGLSLALLSSPALPHSLWSIISLGESSGMNAHFKKAFSLKWIRHSDERSLESSELSETEKYDLLLSSAKEESRKRVRAVIESWNPPPAGEF
jgi:hypothetical protein